MRWSRVPAPPGGPAPGRGRWPQRCENTERRTVPVPGGFRARLRAALGVGAPTLPLGQSRGESMQTLPDDELSTGAESTRAGRWLPDGAPTAPLAREIGMLDEGDRPIEGTPPAAAPRGACARHSGVRVLSRHLSPQAVAPGSLPPSGLPGRSPQPARAARPVSTTGGRSVTAVPQANSERPRIARRRPRRRAARRQLQRAARPGAPT